MITVPGQKLLDGTVIQEQSLIIDHDTYLSLPDYQRKVVYAFDYETQLNDKRIEIQIVDKIYIPQILAEKDRVFQTTT
jgi:hypothetical protein